MGTRRQVFEVVSTILVVACAAAVVAMQGYHFLSSPEPEGHVQVERWREVNALGIWMGHPDAEFIVTTFIDFTCPYCRALAPVLDSLEADQGDRLAIVFHHYPLSRTWSIPSAIAAECAYRQGRFREVAPVLYDAVADLREAPPDWTSVAEQGGIPHVREFLACIELPEDSFPRIDTGKRVGRRTGVRATPTVWVNGTPTEVRDLDGFKSLLEDW